MSLTTWQLSTAATRKADSCCRSHWPLASTVLESTYTCFVTECRHSERWWRLTCFRGSCARARTGAASSSNFSRVMKLRKSMSFIRHSTFSGASGMELSTFFSCRRQLFPSHHASTTFFNENDAGVLYGSPLSYY